MLQKCSALLTFVNYTFVSKSMNTVQNLILPCITMTVMAQPSTAYLQYQFCYHKAKISLQPAVQKWVIQIAIPKYS